LDCSQKLGSSKVVLKGQRQTEPCNAGELFAFRQSCDHACLFDVSVNWQPIRSANSAAGNHSLRHECDRGQSLVTPQSTCACHLLPPMANQSGPRNLMSKEIKSHRPVYKTIFLVKGSIGQVWNPRVLYRTQRNLLGVPNM